MRSGRHQLRPALLLKGVHQAGDAAAAVGCGLARRRQLGGGEAAAHLLGLGFGLGLGLGFRSGFGLE